MFACLSSLLRSLCLYVKHWILDHAHPLPQSGLGVYPGTKGSLQASIAMGVVSAVDIPGMNIFHDYNPFDETDERTCVWIDHERYHGCFAVCRYLGRLWKLYPVTPESALVVDSLLDLMAAFNRPFICEKTVHTDFVHDHLNAYIGELDACMDGEMYLGNMETVSLADIMWYSCIKHVTLVHDIDEFYDKGEYERFHTWWCTMSKKEADDAAEDAAEDDAVRMVEDKKNI